MSSDKHAKKVRKNVMRLGATLHKYCGLRMTEPDAYVRECRRLGFRAATSPDYNFGGHDRAREIAKIFTEADIVIAEIGAWPHCLHPNPDIHRSAINEMAEGLAIADEMGALCCINVAGSRDANKSYAPHPDNFSRDTFDAVVQWIRDVLKLHSPKRTKLVIESCPWSPIDTPDAYEKLLKAVDHDGLAVHLDPVNFITDAHIFYDTTRMLNDCFDRFGDRIVSCHAKDMVQGDPKTVRFSESAPGTGQLDYRTFLRRLNRVSPEMPLIIEHLATQNEYEGAAEFIREVASSLEESEIALGGMRRA